MVNFRKLITGNGFVLGIGDENDKLYVFGDEINKNSISRMGNDGDLYGSKWSSISVNYKHSAAIDINNKLYLWGDNYYGQLGLGSSITNAVDPQLINNDLWSSVSCGAFHTSAIKGDGSLWTWGDNTFGQIGNGTVGGNFSKFFPVQISSYDFNTVSLLMHMDGFNGSSSFTDSSFRNFTLTRVGSPTISTTQSKFGNSSYYKGSSSSCLYTIDDAFKFGSEDFTLEAFVYYLSGNSDYNILMDTRKTSDGTGGSWFGVYNNILYYENKPTINMPTNKWVHIAFVRSSGSLKLYVDGVLSYTISSTIDYSSGYFSIGGATYSSLGATPFNGYIDEVRISKGVPRYLVNFTPTTSAFTNVNEVYTKVVSGTNFNIAIKNDGTLWSWGDNSYGQLGLSDNLPRYFPTQIAGTNWVDISCGDGHVLAIKSNGELYSWGYNQNGECGLGDNLNKNTPNKITLLKANDSSINLVGITVDNQKRITCGRNHSFIIANTAGVNNVLYGTGKNDNGQLGTGDSVAKNFFTAIDLSKRHLSVNAGASHSIVKLDIPANQPTPSPTPTLTVTPTVTKTVTPTVTPTVSITPTITPTKSVTPTITPTISSSPILTRTPTPTVTPSQTPPLRIGISWIPMTAQSKTWSSITYSPALNRFIGGPIGNIGMVSSVGVGNSWQDSNLFPNSIAWDVFDAGDFILGYGPSFFTAISNDGFGWISGPSSRQDTQSQEGSIISVSKIGNQIISLTSPLNGISPLGYRILKKDNASLIFSNKIHPKDSNNKNIIYKDSANYNNVAKTLTDVRYNGGPGPYGTYDMGGNVYNWTDTTAGSYKVYRGNNYLSNYNTTRNYSVSPTTIDGSIGVRFVTTQSSPSYSSFVSVGDAGNSGNSGYGAVPYNYKIQKYPVTCSEYVEFLNAVALNGDPNSLYYTLMSEYSVPYGVKSQIDLSSRNSGNPKVLLTKDVFLYVIHYANGGSYIEVIDTSTDTIVKQIPFGAGGVSNILATFNSDKTKIYIHPYGSYFIYELDTTTNTVSTLTSIFQSSGFSTSWSEMIYDQTNNRLLFLKWGAFEVAAFNLATKTAITIVKNSITTLGFISGFLYNNKLYALSSTYSSLNTTSGTLSVINLSNNTSTDYAIDSGPLSLGFNETTGKIYIGCNNSTTNTNKIKVFNTAQNLFETDISLTLGSRKISKFLVDKTNNKIYVCGGDTNAGNIPPKGFVATIVPGPVSTSVSLLDINTNVETLTLDSTKNKLFASSRSLTGFWDGGTVYPVIVSVIDTSNTTLLKTTQLPINAGTNLVSIDSLNKIYIAGNTSSFVTGSVVSISSLSGTYSVKSGLEYYPARYISFYNAARMANWLSNGKPTGSQTASTTENGAYNLSAGNTGTPERNTANPNTGGGTPLYYIANENEWYKAAAYKGGGTNAGYWNYYTASDKTPKAVSLDSNRETINLVLNSVASREKDGLTVMVGDDIVLVGNPITNLWTKTDIAFTTNSSSYYILMNNSSTIVIIHKSVSSNTSYIYSTDNGTNWTVGTINFPSTTSIGAASYTNGYFVIIPITTTSRTDSVYLSTDGINWTSYNVPYLKGKTWVDMASKDNLIVLLSNSSAGAISYSDEVLIISPTPTPTITTTPSSLSISITEQPSDQSVQLNVDSTAGPTAIFSVSAISRAQISYQWQQSIDNGVSFSNISGENSPSLAISDITLDDNNSKYRVVLTSPGLQTVTSSIATLKVLTGSCIVISQQPMDSVASNASITLTVNVRIPCAESPTPTPTPTVTPSVTRI